MSLTHPGALRSVIGRSLCESKTSTLLWHRYPQEERHGVRAASCGTAPSGSQETEVSYVYAGSEAVAGLAEELPGDRRGHGIDRPVLAVSMECAGGRVRAADTRQSAAH